MRAFFGADDDLTYDRQRRLLDKAFKAEEGGSNPRTDHQEPLLAPDQCFGRETEIAMLTEGIDGLAATAIAVLGPPGIGKTTLTQRIATNEHIITRFGGRRWLVKLDVVTSAVGLEVAIILALGLDPAVKTFRIALRHLRSKPALLVLDNLETPWEQDMAAVQDCLRQLAALPNVFLLVSLRGNVAPIGRNCSPTPLDKFISKFKLLAFGQKTLSSSNVLVWLSSCLDYLPL